MTKKELSEAMVIAKSDVRLDSIDLSHMDGFGLPDFKPVYCTVEQVAKLIRWQCFQFNGGVDANALQEIADCGRKRFLIV